MNEWMKEEMMNDVMDDVMGAEEDEEERYILCYYFELVYILVLLWNLEKANSYILLTSMENLLSHILVSIV